MNEQVLVGDSCGFVVLGIDYYQLVVVGFQCFQVFFYVWYGYDVVVGCQWVVVEYQYEVGVVDVGDWD